MGSVLRIENSTPELAEKLEKILLEESMWVENGILIIETANPDATLKKLKEIGAEAHFKKDEAQHQNINEKINRACRLHASGSSPEEIAKDVGMDVAWVKKTIENYERSMRGEHTTDKEWAERLWKLEREWVEKDKKRLLDEERAKHFKDNSQEADAIMELVQEFWAGEFTGNVRDAQEQSYRMFGDKFSRDVIAKIGSEAYDIYKKGPAMHEKTETEKAAESQLEMGIKVEMEHTDNPETAKKIAEDHLKEMPDYYTRLLKMEKEAKGEKETEEKKEVGSMEKPEEKPSETSKETAPPPAPPKETAAPPEKKEAAQATEPPSEKPADATAPEFDAKAEIENLKKGLATVSEQVSLIREILDKLAEEEESEAPLPDQNKTTEVKPEVKLEADKTKEESKEEKKEEAKMAKDRQLDDALTRLKTLEAEFAKIGVRKTAQSSSVKMNSLEAEVEAELKRRGCL